MKHLLRCLPLTGIALLLAACGPAQPVTYANPDLGLTLTYPGDWQKVERDTIEAGVSELDKKSQMSTAGVTAALDQVVLAVGKKMKGAAEGDAPNLLVMSIPVSAAQCAAARDTRFREVDAQAVHSKMPDARQIISRHVAIAGIDGQTFEFSAIGRKMLQHRYWYCAKNNFVLVQATSSTPEGEAEAKQVLQTVQFAAH